MLLQNSPEKILDPYPGYLSRKVVTQSNSADLRALKYQKTFPTSSSPPFPEKRGKKKKKRGVKGVGNRCPRMSLCLVTGSELLYAEKLAYYSRQSCWLVCEGVRW